MFTYNSLQLFQEFENKRAAMVFVQMSSAFLSVSFRKGKAVHAAQILTGSSIGDYKWNRQLRTKWHGTFFVKKNREFFMKLFKCMFASAAVMFVAASRIVPFSIAIMLALISLTFVGIGSVPSPQPQPCRLPRR
jgi:hypothetical protein